MACFIVPAAEAAVTTVITRVLEKREQQTTVPEYRASEALNNEPFSVRLKRLNSLLWGGSALLAFEHLWHGEIQPFFPFLTAASDPAETAAQIPERRPGADGSNYQYFPRSAHAAYRHLRISGSFGKGTLK